ncbi:fucolectin-like [Saccostrea cucullata]|uniref:fucolectin-like n=1 Tax=Saccostrea cuccullata TaxID=36930 RepID=UPI002ED3742E
MDENRGNYTTEQPGLAKTASLSSVFGEVGNYALFKASNAIDGTTKCGKGINITIACSKQQIDPWLKISLMNTSNVESVLIYNRQDCCGERLHDVRVDVIDNGRNVSCGFYPGPAANGDRILILCERETRGNEVIISILSKDGQPDYLQVCEVEIYGRS